MVEWVSGVVQRSSTLKIAQITVAHNTKSVL